MRFSLPSSALLQIIVSAYQTSDFLDCRLKDEPAVIQQKPAMKWMYVGSDETDLEIIGEVKTEKTIVSCTILWT